jgi:hypothetical protein
MQKNSELILDVKDSKIVYTTSWLFLLNSLYGFYDGEHPFISFLLSCIFFNSINYWRNPIRGFRRNLDIFTNVASIGYVSYYLYEYHNNHLYYYCILGVKLSFLLSWMVYNLNMVKLSIILHCCTHFLGNMSVSLLFIDIIRLNNTIPIT